VTEPVLRVRHPPGYPSERRYITDVLLTEFLGLDHVMEETRSRDVEISLNDDVDGTRVVMPDVLFGTPPETWLTADSLPRRPLQRNRLQSSRLLPRLVSPVLPVIYGGPPGDARLVCEDEAGIRLGVDVFGSAFFMLTRYEELVRIERDPHARFSVAGSLAAVEGLVDRPIVNEYLELLWSAMSSLWPGLRRRQRQFRLRASHDIDWRFCTGATVREMARYVAGDVVRRRDVPLALRRVETYVRKRSGDPGADLCDTFDLLMDATERRGLRSSFYFIADHTNPEMDGDYSLDDPWIAPVLRRIHERGHDVGLQPSYDTYLDPAQTRAELERLVAVCERLGIRQSRWGGRQHFLRWENPITWQNWDDAGLAYDSTLGYADRGGFRCGVCFEYPVFNLRTRRRLHLRERPLVAMDTALLQHAKLGSGEALEEITRLKRRCRLFDGEFTLLWHNTRARSPRERRLFEASLDAG
jgi:hypothetical protein